MHLYCSFSVHMYNEMDILCTGHCMVNSSSSLPCILMKAFSLANANEVAPTFLQWHLMWLVCNSMWWDGSCDFWTSAVLQVSGAVSSPAAPWPHLAPSICALSATFCHSAPTSATLLYICDAWREKGSLLGERSMSEVKKTKKTQTLWHYRWQSPSILKPHWVHIEYWNASIKQCCISAIGVC